MSRTELAARLYVEFLGHWQYLHEVTEGERRAVAREAWAAADTFFEEAPRSRPKEIG